jgi:integrase
VTVDLSTWVGLPLLRMFNLAITWDLYFGLNPVRKVRFLREFNNRLRVLSSEEEEKLLQNAIPYLQDLIRFALNTGLRTGEIFSLRWSHVDLQRGILSVFASKTQTIREITINSEARKVLEAWKLNQKNEILFYNPQTGKPFVDLKTGFALACEKAGIADVTWHTLRHTFASRLVKPWRRYSDSQRIARTFEHQRHDAIRTHKYREQTRRS